MQLSTIQPEQERIGQVYVTEDGEFYYQNEILENYDLHGNFLGYAKINKFIKHKKYWAVNFNSLEYNTKNWTLNIDCLGKNYRHCTK